LFAYHGPHDDDDDDDDAHQCNVYTPAMRLTASSTNERITDTLCRNARRRWR
jgi:hypothetical protein